MANRIKGKALVLMLCLSLCQVVKAQIGEYRSVLSLGVNGGVQFSSVDFDPTIKQNQLLRPTFGLTMRYTCEKYFTTVCAIQIELNYMKMGWKEEILNASSDPLPDKYERTLNYLQLPVMARLSWGKEERGAMFFIQLGPEIGYYLGSSTKKSDIWTLNSSGNPDRPNNVFQQYGMEVQRKFDYGLTAGLGMGLNTAIGHFDLEGRYYFGLNDIFNNSKKDVFGRSAHRSIICKLTYLFDVIKQ